MYYKGTNFKDVDKITKYQIEDPSTTNLCNLGFRYKRSMSDAEDDVYEVFFPVYRYHAAISLEARFLIWQQRNTLTVDVFDTTTHGTYGPWYSDESGIQAKIIKIINKNILKQMKYMNITEKEQA